MWQQRLRRIASISALLLLAVLSRFNMWISVYRVGGKQMEKTVPTRNLCSREQIKHGEWIPITLPEAPYFPAPKHHCRPHEEYGPGIPWKTWFWQPHAVAASSCTLLHWNASHFCSLARFATISIVGDSLSAQQYLSLVQLLGGTIPENEQNQTDVVPGSTITQYACQRQVRLVFFRDNYLSQVPQALNASQPHVVIINRGAHYVHNNILETDLRRVAVDLKDWQDKSKNASRPCHLFVRTSVPGHPQCWKMAGPAKSVNDTEAHIANLTLYTPRGHNKNWPLFQEQNLLSLRVYREANLTFNVIDGYHINILRPDDHQLALVHRNGGPFFRDCLHTCYPGSVDIYNQLLLHFLARQGGVGATEADVTWAVPF